MLGGTVRSVLTQALSGADIRDGRAGREGQRVLQAPHLMDQPEGTRIRTLTVITRTVTVIIRTLTVITRTVTVITRTLMISWTHQKVRTTMEAA